MDKNRTANGRAFFRFARGSDKYLGHCAALRRLAPYRNPILPSLAGNQSAEEQQLRDDARAGLEKRLEIAGIVDAPNGRYILTEQEFESDVISSMGFSGYFLIVADFIKWAKEQDIAVGPGRGSGAGSFVAWALTITDLDPIKLGCCLNVPEPGPGVDARFRYRFLRNPSRGSHPLCAEEIWKASGCANHHLRKTESTCRIEGYGAGLADELWSG